MMIPFAKMHGIGNDFILMNEKDLNVTLNISDLAASVCHRRFGIGADGLMIVRPSSIADARMDYYNSDGSLGEMCGNGIRCFARYVDTERSAESRKLTIETMAGIKELTIRNLDEKQSIVSVNMGIPTFHDVDNKIMINDVEYNYSYLTMGVPHVVIFIDEINDYITNIVGPLLERHENFMNGTNVNFCYIKNRKNVSVFTWERGAGHTLACGTGITSTYAVAVHMGKVDNHVLVQAEGGNLELETIDNGIKMTGPAADICVGHYPD